MGRKNRFRGSGDFRSGGSTSCGNADDRQGLDFPNVTWSGDRRRPVHCTFPTSGPTSGLSAARAGGRPLRRGDRAGRVIVQTFTAVVRPDPVLAPMRTMPVFAAAELASRREFQYPPYRHIIHHLFRGPNPEKLQFFASQWAQAGRRGVRKPAGAARADAAPIEKIKGLYRWQLWYFTPGVSQVIGELARLRDGSPGPGTSPRRST